MFAASKILAFTLEPLFWVLALLLAGLLLMRWRPRLGKGLAWLALLALVLACWLPIPVLLLRHLEAQYPQIPDGADLGRYAGVVVLGGALSNSDIWAVHHQVGLNEQAERMTVAVGLVRKHPQLKLIFTGGIASLPPKGLPEATLAKAFFDDMGVAPAQVQYEAASRNTFENATLSASLPGVDKKQPWLLLTSAFHMPRSMAVFQSAGWNVTPYPVDYRSAYPPSWYDFSMHDGPHTWELALHELLGYYAYRLSNMI